MSARKMTHTDCNLASWHSAQEFAEFESVLLNLSEMLVMLPLEQSDSNLAQGLDKLVAWMKVDQGILIQLAEDRTARWQTPASANAAKIETTYLAAEEISWLVEKTLYADGVIYKQASTMPVEADKTDQEWAFMQRRGIGSYAAVLLQSGSILLGLLVFETHRADYGWPNNLIPRLGLIGNIFTGVLLGKYEEDTLRDAHDHVVATLKAIPDMMLEVDQTGHIYDYRLPAHEPFPLPMGSLVGQNISQVLSPAAADVLHEALVGATRQVHYRSAPYTLDTADGQRWYELSAAVKGISEAEDSHFIVFIRDITERMRAEEVLRERDRLRVALETEKELHRIKNDLMRTISHEFRVPLAVIGLSNSLLNDYFDRLTFQQRTNQHNTIRGQLNKLEQMVSEILAAVSDVFSGLTFEPSTTDLAMLCQLSVSEVQATIGTRHQIIFANHNCPRTARIDQRLVNRILINLLSNAIKYSPDGSLIRLNVFEDEADTILQVIDQGIGISKEDQQHLFEPFFRAKNVGSTNGFGLGLSIVRDCVALHQGMVTVTSQLEHGTTFTVRLPKKDHAGTNH